MAADLAASICQWLHLIEEFDREGGWAEAGLPSCAAWLSWMCSVAPGTAREYVRVARALPQLPLVDGAFAAGELSYSKVRVLIQVAAEVDEAVLLQQARVQTVSQLERTVRAYRRTDGWSQQRKRRATWRWDDDGMLVLSARLPADEGALLVAALERAGDDVAPRPEESCGDSTGRSTPPPTADDRQRAALTGADPLGVAGADMLVALAERALAAGDVDSSGDDRHLLILHADLGSLTDDPASESPGGDSGSTGGGEGSAGDDSGSTGGGDGSVEGGAGSATADAVAADSTVTPAAGRHAWRRTAAGGTLARPRCHLENGPGLDRRTAQRIACDAALVAVLHHVGKGEPLRLGRKTRAISPAQRRALRVRDGGCRFPGCHRRKHLEAHHVRYWSLWGPTDLENLVLLCPYHHTLVHEGGFQVSPGADEGRWEFHDPHGTRVPEIPPLPGAAGDGAPPARAADPLGLLPGWAGEPFHLAETVAVLSGHPRSGVR